MQEQYAAVLKDMHSMKLEGDIKIKETSQECEVLVAELDCLKKENKKEEDV